MYELAFTKANGTRNDFVVFTDAHAEVTLSDAQVAFLCDRRAGIGADGVLRAVKASELPEWDGPGDVWFMDYRNADGSVAEMCGNGLRVFVRYLLDEGLAVGDEVTVATRAGQRSGRPLADGRIAVTMGQVRVGADDVDVHVGDRRWQGVPVDVGNPHVVSIVADGILDELDLSVPPEVPEGRFPDGVNAEFVELTGPDAIRMRVHERGVGETCSCGTGVVAAAVAAGGASAGGAPVRVTTRGGELEVTVNDDGEAILTGPAVLVARGTISLEGVA